MPELPECEAARQRIASGALHRTIKEFVLGEVSHMDLPGEAERERLMGTQFTRTRRHGKNIFVGSVDGPWLNVHLGMSGSIRVMDDSEDLADFIRFSVKFEGGQSLHFRDPRKFGRISLVEAVDDVIEAKELGPDALEIGSNDFADAVGTTRGAIKSALLNQRKLAGVGNLWSDEVLFQTGIAPSERACDLESEQITALHQALQDILNAVVETDATYSELPGDWLIHHRADGEDCPRCAAPLSKKTVGGRTSYFCPDHQVGASG